MREHSSNNQVDFNGLLGRKFKSCAEFLAATFQLKDALEAEDMIKVQQLTKLREDMTRLINGLDQQMNQSNLEDGGDKNKRAIITEGLKKILHKIYEINRDCERVAALKYDLAKSDLTTVHHKGKVISGYVNKTGGIPKFLDVQT